MKSPKIEENSARRARPPCLPFLGLRQELKVKVLSPTCNEGQLFVRGDHGLNR